MPDWLEDAYLHHTPENGLITIEVHSDFSGLSWVTWEIDGRCSGEIPAILLKPWCEETLRSFEIGLVTLYTKGLSQSLVDKVVKTYQSKGIAVRV